MSNLEQIHPELRTRLQEVTDQYRIARVRRGWVQFGITTFVLTCLFTMLLVSIRGDITMAWALIGTFLAFEAIAVVVQVMIPGLRSIDPRRVALYIDEHHPELENRIISAFEASNATDQGASEWLVEQLIEDTVPRLRGGALQDVAGESSSAMTVVVVVAMVVLSLAVAGSSYKSWLPGTSGYVPEGMTASRSLPFTVEPGNARVRRGDNQMVLIRTAEENLAVKVQWRIGNGVWEQAAATPSNSDNVYFQQFANIQDTIQYNVSLDNRQSDTYQITVWTPPEVETINLTYDYPEYTQMASREEPNSGNITALEGTIVEMDVVVNKPLSRAELEFDTGEIVPLTASGDATLWETTLTIDRSDKYRVLLYDLEGESSEYNPEYFVAMLRDRAPEIDIDFPRGDNEVTLLEELSFDFSVTDDFGFNEFGIQYEVAGKDPVRIPLSTNDELVRASEGHHEIELDDLDLEVGDFITWTVWAKDTHPSRGEYEDMGDPFFFEIRPFKMLYSEAMSGAGGGAGAGGQQDDLAQGQKDVLIATWNLRRSAKYMDDEEFTEKRGIIVDKQRELQAMVNEMMSPQAPPEVPKLMDAMSGSLDGLTRAALPDPKQELSEATTQQQLSSRLIARLKGNEAQVQQQQGSGGGGGGQGQTPDISELEMARNRNFYEEENATREQQAQTDAVLDRIKELAQRQQNANEELANLISELQAAETQEEKDEIQRKLEKLEEELKQNLERADQARRDLSSDALSNEQTREAQESLENARHQIQRSLEQLEREELQKARASGSRAMDALTDMQESLQQFSRGMAAQRMQELLEQMEDLKAQQDEILEKTNEGLKEHNRPDFSEGDSNETRKDEILSQKQELAQEFVNMMDEASELAERGRETQELMSRKLGDWLRQTSREGIMEDIEETEDFVRYGVWDSAVEEELGIADKLNRAQEELMKVADAITDDDLEGMQKALGHLDELLQSEEMQMAMGEPGEGPQEGQVPGQGEEEGDVPGQSESEDGEQRGPGEGAPTDEPSDLQQPGQGEGQGDGQGEPTDEEQESQQPGQGEGQGQGEPTDQQSQSQQPGQGQGIGNQQPEMQPELQPNQEGVDQGGNMNQNGGNPDSGASRGAGGPNDMMRNFATDQYRNWLQELRDAEALLPEESPVRDQITRIREDIEAIRREWRNRARPPQFDLFLEVAARPLQDAAEDLQNAIEKELGEKEFVMVDEGDIPERFRERVANYFKGLSESETAPE